MASKRSKDKNSAVRSSNKFSVELFKVLSDDQSNIFFSPASVSIALAMTYLGSRENTAAQLASALHWTDRDALNKDMAELVTSLNSLATGGNTVSLANRLWLQRNFDILVSYWDNLEKFYRSTVTQASFVENAEEIRQDINKWVSESTQGKIQDLISPGILNSLTRLVLVNAIYFKGVWKSEFNEDETFTGNFHVTQDNLKKIPMMSRSGRYGYGECTELDAQVLELPYTNDQLSMIIILPKEIHDLPQVEQKLTNKTLKAARFGLRPMKVEVTIPKFKMTSQFELSHILPKMGVTDLFDQLKADLSGITGDIDLHVSNVIHKAFVDVNEKGTEAAAATAVVMMTRCMPPPVPRFFANHPFLFLIQENKTGAILFLGRLQDPSC